MLFLREICKTKFLILFFINLPQLFSFSFLILRKYSSNNEKVIYVQRMMRVLIDLIIALIILIILFNLLQQKHRLEHFNYLMGRKQLWHKKAINAKKHKNLIDR